MSQLCCKFLFQRGNLICQPHIFSRLFLENVDVNAMTFLLYLNLEIDVIFRAGTSHPH